MRTRMFIPLAASILAVALGAAPARAQLSVSDVMVISSNGGEAQSTVVGPRLKAECPAGRFLVTNDWTIIGSNPAAPSRGMVLGRNLDSATGPVVSARFDAIADPGAQVVYGTDHDLVSLSNGDVLLVDTVSSRAPLFPTPDWFSSSYRQRAADWFGPGARTVIFVWKSTDCGETFHKVAEFDPARVRDGSCAYPQQRWSKNGILPPVTTPPGSSKLPVWDMGGTDGILTKVDHLNDRLVMMHQCVGYERVLPPAQPFMLTDKPLDRTLLVTSVDAGETWTPMATVPRRGWRMGVEATPYVPGVKNPFDQFSIAIDGTNFTFASKRGDGTYEMDGFVQPISNDAVWGWTDAFAKNPLAGTEGHRYIGSNIWAHTILARLPAARGFLFAFPSVIKRSAGDTYGYRLFAVEDGVPTELDPIVPTQADTDGFTMHLSAIDLGEGPVMLYWTDMNGKTKQGTVRGRVIIASSWRTDDFDVDVVGGNRHSWNLTEGQYGYWFGDFRTAGGYRDRRYHYYPMWVETDGTMRYAHVNFDLEIHVLAERRPEAPLPSGLHRVRPVIRPVPARVPFSVLPNDSPARMQDLDYDDEKRREGRD